MKTITILDTAAASNNVGDEIIMDAVDAVLREVFPDAYFYRVPTHDSISDWSRRFIGESDLAVIGGTNILGPRMGPDDQWKLAPETVDRLAGRTVALAVGWHSYTEKPGWRQGRLIRRLLSSPFEHSARDQHTDDQLKELRVRSRNTACATMWGLDEAFCRSIPTAKAPAVVTTLTRWRADHAADRAFLERLKALYGEVWYWPQMREDAGYAEELSPPGVGGLRPVPANLAGYDRFLDEHDVDYVGTRLHGGIRALQRGRRTLIVEVDNRAAEIARDTGLPTVRRGDLPALDAWVDGAAPTRIRIPTAEIAAWKAQFKDGPP